MILITLGIFAFIIGSVLSKQGNPATEKTSKLLYIVGPILIVIGVLTSCFITVEPGKVGVKSLFGKVDEQVLYSGLNFVNPLVKIITFDVRTQNYTMSGSHEEGTQKGDDAIRILTADGLEVVIDLSVLFNVKSEQAPKILQQIGTDYLDKIVRPVSRTAIRDNAVSYDAVALYSTKRDEFQNKIYNTIEKNFADRGLRLEQLLIRNIT